MIDGGAAQRRRQFRGRGRDAGFRPSCGRVTDRIIKDEGIVRAWASSTMFQDAPMVFAIVGHAVKHSRGINDPTTAVCR